MFISCLLSYFVLTSTIAQSTGTIISSYTADSAKWMKNTAENEFIKFSNHSQLGSGLTIGGAFLSIMGGTMYANRITTYANGATSINTSKETGGLALMVVGGITSLVGTCFIIEAPIHIKRAALIMNANGIGVKVKM
jgi:hypothetical protein